MGRTAFTSQIFAATIAVAVVALGFIQDWKPWLEERIGYIARPADQTQALQAEQLAAADKFEQAIESATKALSINSGNVLAHRVRGFAHYKLRNYDQAIADLKFVAESPGKQDDNVILTLAGIYRETGKPKQAIDIAEKWIKSTKTTDQEHLQLAYWMIGKSYNDLGKTEQAVEAMEAVLDTQPYNPMLVRDYAETAAKLGEYYAALDAIEEALGEEHRNEPVLLATREKIRQLMYNRGYRDHRKRRRDPMPYIDAAYSFILQGEHTSAYLACNRAIELNPKLPIAYRMLGDTCFSQGHYADGIKAYQQALKLNPNYDYCEQKIEYGNKKLKQAQATKNLSQ